MGESRYKQAYNKGITDGRELALREIGYSNLDEAYESGICKGLTIAIETVLELGDKYPDDILETLVEEQKKHRS